MTAIIQQLGDKTSHDVKPDFDGAKGYNWVKMTREMKAAGTEHLFPHKPRKGAAETSFFNQVDRHVSRLTFSQSFYMKDGKVIKE